MESECEEELNMPNWCYTAYHFQGKENELKILYDKINEWTSKQFIETGFGDSWLGNILYGVGLQDCINNPVGSLSYFVCILQWFFLATSFSRFLQAVFCLWPHDAFWRVAA